MVLAPTNLEFHAKINVETTAKTVSNAKMLKKRL